MKAAHRRRLRLGAETLRVFSRTALGTVNGAALNLSQIVATNCGSCPCWSQGPCGQTNGNGDTCIDTANTCPGSIGCGA